MMDKTNIALVGFMGAGKTVTSQLLAHELGLKRVSTDDDIIEREGCSINEIFAAKGEPYFRRIEQEVVKDLAGQPQLVIDCGGGVVLNPNNVSALKERGVVFYLKTSPDVIYARVKDEMHRPLLQVADPMAKITALLKERAPHYAQADYEVVTDGKSPRQVMEEIIDIFQKGNKGTGE